MSTRINDMLSRSKIKMEESIRHTANEDRNGESPRYQPRESPRYHQKAEEEINYRGSYNEQQFRQMEAQERRLEAELGLTDGSRGKDGQDSTKYQRVQLDYQPRESNYSKQRQHMMMQLRQEYQILRNLNVEESVILQKNKSAKNLSGDDSLASSSVMEKKQSKTKRQEYSQEMQQILSEKKQLEIVIGNSMRKIEQLLENEIGLKKTIHELKLQIEGKGGIHQEYERTIKTFQKNEEELTAELARHKAEVERNIFKVKEMTERVRILQNQLSNREKQYRQSYEEQRKLHEAIRQEKDKFLNMEIQYKSVKMEMEMMEKDKNAEIARLTRRHEGKETGPDKELPMLVRKLEEEIREKEKRILVISHEFQMYRKDIQKAKEKEKALRDDKELLEQMVNKTKEHNETHSKALTESVNILFAKISQIEKKSEESLKKQIEALKSKQAKQGNEAVRDNESFKPKGPSQNEQELLQRVLQLEKMIDKEVKQKNRLMEEIHKLQNHRIELNQDNTTMELKIRKLNQTESRLQEEIDAMREDLRVMELVKQEAQAKGHENKLIKEELNQYILRERDYQQTVEDSRTALEHKSSTHQEEIRALRRKLDEALFQVSKAKKQGELTISMLKSTQQSDMQKLLAEMARMKQNMAETDRENNQAKQVLTAKCAEKDKQLADKDRQISEFKTAIQRLNGAHSTELQVFNDKFLQLSTANEKLLGQMGNYAALSRQVVEMRKLLKHSKNINSSVDHLWQVKEAEYSSLNQILRLFDENTVAVGH